MKLSSTHWRSPSPHGRAVLIHGITGNASSWWRVAATLANHGWDVTAPDLPGHGNSPTPRTQHGLDDLVDDIVDTVGSKTDVLIGHSFGATLALRAAATGALTAPLTVLEDPVLKLERDAAIAIAEREISWLPPSTEELRRQNPLWDPQDCAARILAHYQVQPEAIRGIWTGNTPWDLAPLIPVAARHTALKVIMPAESPYIDAHLRRSLSSWLGPENARSVASGHSVHREAFEPFRALLNSWLDEAPPAERSADGEQSFEQPSPDVHAPGV